MAGDSKDNLEAFFKAPVNTTTRERIFFSRLSFDLKIAAARAGYHLHLYEPDVDRDGFDIVLEDEDTTRQVQTKAVLSSVGTSGWDITAGLLRASVEDQDVYQIAPVEAGRGGAVVLIEIDASDQQGKVTYSYTDYEILTAIAEGYLQATPPPPRPGPKPASAREEAQSVLQQLWRVERNSKVTLSRRLFVRLTNPDQLLGMIGMRSNWAGFGRFAVRDAISNRIEVDETGKLKAGSKIEIAAIVRHHLAALVDAQPADTAPNGTLFRAFQWDRP